MEIHPMHIIQLIVNNLSVNRLNVFELVKFNQNVITNLLIFNLPKP